MDIRRIKTSISAALFTVFAVLVLLSPSADACGITAEEAKHGVKVRVEKNGKASKGFAEFVVPSGKEGQLIKCVDSKYVPRTQPNGGPGFMQFGLNYDYGTGTYRGQIYYRYVDGNQDGPRSFSSVILKPGKYRLEIDPSAGLGSWAEMSVVW